MKEQSLNIETERKYLIEMPDTEKLRESGAAVYSNISQTYLSCEGNDERVRKREYPDHTVYTHTRKSPLSGISRIEEENEISRDEYERLLQRADPAMATVDKTRYEIRHAGKCFEIDVYPFEVKTAVMEIELSSEDEEFEFPPFINVIREVTSDKRFSNKALAQKLKSGPEGKIMPD